MPAFLLFSLILGAPVGGCTAMIVGITWCGVAFMATITSYLCLRDLKDKRVVGGVRWVYC